jgi:hypothetical protein
MEVRAGCRRSSGIVFGRGLFVAETPQNDDLIWRIRGRRRWHEGVVAVGRDVRAQAYLFAYSDAFYVMGAALIVAVVTTVLMAKGRDGAAGAH